MPYTTDINEGIHAETVTYDAGCERQIMLVRSRLIQTEND